MVTVIWKEISHDMQEQSRKRKDQSPIINSKMLKNQQVWHRHRLSGGQPRQNPLLKNQHLQEWIKFAAAHLDKPSAFLEKVIHDQTRQRLNCFLHFARKNTSSSQDET